MKKALSLLLVLALFMSIGLSAWAAPVRASDESTAEQIYLILAQFDSLKQDGGSDAWLYAVTDLDHNGRLELIAAPAQGGMQPCVWEAGTDGKTLSAPSAAPGISPSPPSPSTTPTPITIRQATPGTMPSTRTEKCPPTRSMTANAPSAWLTAL